MPSREQIRQMLAPHVGRSIKLHLSDGEPFITTLRNVDEEGFVHEMEESSSEEPYWTRYEDVISADPLPPAREP